MKAPPDIIDRLRLIRTPGIGPISHRQLLLRFGCAEKALAALPDLARRGGGKSPPICSAASAEREIQAVERGRRDLSCQGCRALSQGAGAARGFAAAADRQGQLEPTRQADGGDRRRPQCQRCGLSLCPGLASDLGHHGFFVVSGLARGIDSAAHDGAMDLGTIAVMAGGIDVYYPPENEGRQKEIAHRGLLIAEMPPGTEPRARHFPYRNRIIAGMAAGTVVIEAAPQSGSLITARLAAEAGRDVMAVPGSPLDPRAQGCNQLILVQCAADVAECLLPDRAAFVADPTPPASLFHTTRAEVDGHVRNDIERLLGHSAVPVDELVRQSGADPGDVQLVLLEMDLAGRLDRHAGNKVSLSG